jgi:hypothetical protein
LKDYKWKLVSNACNDELNHAIENGLGDIDVMESDGTWYNYNFVETSRKLLHIKGDNKPEEIRCIQGKMNILLKMSERFY